MVVVFDTKEITPKDYNFIISNTILSQKESFTYDSIKEYIFNLLKKDKKDLTLNKILNDCILRLRDDGFLSVLGSKYTVVKINI